MKKNKIIYWITTGIFSAMMLMSGIMYFMMDKAKEGFIHAGFPNFFRMELGTAKVLGALALLLPIVPRKLKDFAYAGFTITLVSAFITHLSIGDPFSNALSPLLFLALMVASYIYSYKINAH